MAQAGTQVGVGRVVVRGVVCALLGVVVGIVGTVAHRAPVLDGPVPVGLVLALLAVLAAGILSRAWAGMAGVLGYGVGWVAIVQLLSLQGPGGDVLIPAQTIGYVWIYGGLVVVAVVAFLPRSWFSDRPVRRPLHERPSGLVVPSGPGVGTDSQG
ncbi:hypothetical protein IF650_12595 [Cellulosimicrobium terreum]|nr:hypothetical protein [Cellulosimicrobium terreum]